MTDLHLKSNKTPKSQGLKKVSFPASSAVLFQQFAYILQWAFGMEVQILAQNNSIRN